MADGRHAPFLLRAEAFNEALVARQRHGGAAAGAASPRGEVDREARELLAKVGLADKHAAYPDQLSGSQQQRVAIARALMLQPDLLLLDEVTAALDPELVHEVLDTIRTLAAGGMTMLLVSHEMHFVREIADMVVMMDAGRIVETGPAASIFDAPKADRTSTFMAKVRRA